VNLGEIRQAVYDQIDWAPTQSAEAKRRANVFVQRAINMLALDAPFLFFETTVHFATEPDVVPTLATDLIRIRNSAAGIDDPWVFTVDIAASPLTANAVIWKNDRSWDGRTIEILDADGVYHRNQIRTVWLDGTEVCFTVVKPWDVTNLTVGPFSYRIYTNDYALPDDTIHINSIRFYDQGQNYPLVAMSQDQAESIAYDLPRGQTSSGTPRYYYRRRHRKITGPKRAPTAALGLGTGVETWEGPEPKGSFQYRITYAWGKRDVEFRNSGLSMFDDVETQWLNNGLAAGSFAAGGAAAGMNRSREPRWESAPGPESAVVTHIQSNDSIKLVIPDIEYAQGFRVDTVGFDRDSQFQSGWHARIWRKRLTENFTGYSGLTNDVTTLSRMDFAQDYYLLGEVRIDAGTNGVFHDRGEYIPDYHRRLRDVHGYQTIQFYPLPNARLEADVRVIQRPRIPVDDTDTVEIHAEALDILIYQVAAFLYESEGNEPKKQSALADYRHRLGQIKKRYGLVQPGSQVTLKRPGRAFRRRRAHSHRWWRSDS
jgi:hypothetical protein